MVVSAERYQSQSLSRGCVLIGYKKTGPIGGTLVSVCCCIELYDALYRSLGAVQSSVSVLIRPISAQISIGVGVSKEKPKFSLGCQESPYDAASVAREKRTVRRLTPAGEINSQMCAHIVLDQSD